jgi:hypothetical protein
MPRWSSSNNAAQAEAQVVSLVFLAELIFDSGAVRVHDGSGELVYNGNTYLGIGQYGGFDLVEENIDFVARGIKFTLSGVDNSLVVTTMTETYQNRAATLFLGLINADTRQFIDPPEEVWGGRMDTMSIEIGQNSSVITLSGEHRLRREAPGGRSTDADQQLRYPGDLFFDHQQNIPGYVASWGERPQSFGGGGGRGRDPLGPIRPV